MVDLEIYLYPANITSAKVMYTRKILDLVYNNDVTNTEIPKNMEQALIDRVVAQINIIKAGGQLTQLTIADIDKRIAKMYQLEGAKPEKQDKKVTQ